MNRLIAAGTPIPIYPSGGFTAPGKTPIPEGTEVSEFASIISKTIGVMTVVAIIWFLFILITGAIGLMGAGGDKQAAEGARKKITSGALGLLIVFLAIVITSLVGKFVGMSNILDIQGLFDLIN